MMRTVSSARALNLLCKALLSVQVLTASVSALAADAGEIRFVIGQARVVDAAGSARPAVAGEHIAAGDRVETTANGHVHLRFVDGGFLSVRPGSRLTVEQYDTTAANTAIRFRLDEGVVRSITGDAAKAHKDRFRLNTPLAAIGVRGTDFVVQAAADNLRAVVNQGAIVVAPFGGGCVAQSFGPCATAGSRELSDTMGRVLLELNGVQPARIVPLNGKGPDISTPPVPQESASRQALMAAVEKTGADTTTNQSRNPVPPVTPQDPVVVTPPPPVPTIPTTPQDSPASAALQWGHWGSATRAGDTMSSSYAVASDGRKVTVGDAYFALFRAPSDIPVLSTQLGQGSFALSSGQVSLLQNDGGISAGRIEGGWLKIDFVQRNFATGLNLSHAQTGSVLLQSVGKVRDDGIFAVTEGGTQVAGAVTMDGSQAGYLFNKVVPQGTLSGVTLWKR